MLRLKFRLGGLLLAFTWVQRICATQAAQAAITQRMQPALEAQNSGTTERSDATANFKLGFSTKGGFTIQQHQMNIRDSFCNPGII